LQVTDLARAIGDAKTVADLEALSESLSNAFNTAFGNETDGCYDKCTTQTALALALTLGVAGNGTAATSQRLLEAVQAHAGHMSVGIIGGKFLHDALKAGGQEETALALLEQTDYPSLGYFFANAMEPATTNLWELPDALAEGTGMNSRNHHMWSAYSAYLVRSVAGLDPAAHAPRTFTMRPASTEGLASATVDMRTPYGTVSLAWRSHGGAQSAQVAAGLGDTADLDCGSSGGVIESVEFASFGAPGYERGAPLRWAADPLCHASTSQAIAAKLCVGFASCRVPSDASYFSPLPEACHLDLARPLKLWLKVRCARPLSLHVATSVPLAAKVVLELPAFRLLENRSTVELLEGGVHVPVASSYERHERESISLPAGIRTASVATDHAQRSIVRVELGSGSYSFVLH
jgi:hypothetical protein